MKYIFVVGGVISGVGKGVATASIGRILKECGFSVTAVKIDPYINCDAGTMRPTEHGEVWVTEDGGEIDQDLGNYERFLEVELSKKNNITTGQVYKSLIEKERRGDFLGKTVQFIPHVPNEIKRRIRECSEGYDFVLVEIGGTIGDYENIPFLFAAKSLEQELGKENVSYILVSYMPVPSHIDEMKTKPTQLAIKLLREQGIQPDFILCRGKTRLDDVRKEKIARYSNVDKSHIISMPDVTGKNTPDTIYVIPLDLEEERFSEKISKVMAFENGRCSLDSWRGAVERLVKPQKKIEIALVGKYLDSGNFQLRDSYISVAEALKHAGAKNSVDVSINWVDSKEIEKGNVNLAEYDGFIVPGGFGSSGVEGKIKAIEYARKNNVPFLGLCLGLQLAVVEFSRNVCNLEGAHSTEINQFAKNPVIDILPEQKKISSKGGTMRLGGYEAVLKEKTKTFELYKNAERIFDGKVSERHRHRYEVNPSYHEILKENGMIFSGLSEDKRLVEFIEIPKHKFFIATQSHPEFKSSLLKPAPLFDGFVGAAVGGGRESFLG